MSEQYFSREPSSGSRPAACAFSYRGRSLRFETDAGVFSRGELDTGSRLLLDSLPALSGEVLDLGCGWGALGVAVASANPGAAVTMVDVNLRALALARRNAEVNRVSVRVLESDGFAGLGTQRFDAVVTNPPIRAGKQVIYRLFADAAERLNPGGALFLVIRKQQGAESAMRYLTTLFPRTERIARDAGFWVIRCEKTEEDGKQADISRVVRFLKHN
nr:Ribosomal RNA small subunit methyltransferase C [uncultured bacterium]